MGRGWWRLVGRCCVVALGCDGGHTHSWEKEKGEGIHTFSLPSE